MHQFAFTTIFELYCSSKKQTQVKMKITLAKTNFPPPASLLKAPPPHSASCHMSKTKSTKRDCHILDSNWHFFSLQKTRQKSLFVEIEKWWKKFVISIKTKIMPESARAAVGLQSGHLGHLMAIWPFEASDFDQNEKLQKRILSLYSS